MYFHNSHLRGLSPHTFFHLVELFHNLFISASVAADLQRQTHFFSSWEIPLQSVSRSFLLHVAKMYCLAVFLLSVLPDDPSDFEGGWSFLFSTPQKCCRRFCWLNPPIKFSGCRTLHVCTNPPLCTALCQLSFHRVMIYLEFSVRSKSGNTSGLHNLYSL